MKSCCCELSLRRGSIAAAIYTMVCLKYLYFIYLYYRMSNISISLSYISILSYMSISVSYICILSYVICLFIYNWYLLSAKECKLIFLSTGSDNWSDTGNDEYCWWRKIVVATISCNDNYSWRLLVVTTTSRDDNECWKKYLLTKGCDGGVKRRGYQERHFFVDNLMVKLTYFDIFLCQK